MRKTFFTIIMCAVILLVFTGCGGMGYDNQSVKDSDKVNVQRSTEGLINCNPDPDGEPWYAGGVVMPSQDELDKIPGYESELLLSGFMPAKINNAELKYFRPIFSQIGGSCAQASGIGYQFTYEINYLRDKDSSLIENMYPSNWTYNFVNSGSLSRGSWMYWGWEIIKDNGIPNALVYGDDVGYGDYRWPSDYDVYYSALSNRTLRNYIKYLRTVEDLEVLKGYLYDHNNGQYAGGVFTFAANISGSVYKTLENGKKILTHFGTTGGHAMTIVGYDDTVRYDYNGDGQFTNHIDINNDGVVNVEDYENGAFIMANSWGTSYQDSGFVYIPYKVFAMSSSEGGIWSNAAYIVEVKETNDVSHTVKLKMSYSRRSDLVISTGVTTDLTKNTPDETQSYSVFKYNSGNLPLNGKDDAPIEIGLDLTELLKDINTENDYRIFVNINRGDTTGSGELLAASLIDYTNSLKEYFSVQSNVSLSGSDREIVIIIDKKEYSDEGSSPANPILISAKHIDADIDLTQGFVWIKFNEVPIGWGIGNAGGMFNVTVENLNGSITEASGQTWWFQPTQNEKSQLVKITKVDGFSNVKVKYW